MHHGDRVVAEALPSTLDDLSIPGAPSPQQALEARKGFRGFIDHPFPNCFVCGPNRAEGDGLRIHPGWMDGGMRPERVRGPPRLSRRLRPDGRWHRRPHAGSGPHDRRDLPTPSDGRVFGRDRLDRRAPGPKAPLRHRPMGRRRHPPSRRSCNLNCSSSSASLELICFEGSTRLIAPASFEANLAPLAQMVRSEIGGPLCMR